MIEKRKRNRFLSTFTFILVYLILAVTGNLVAQEPSGGEMDGDSLISVAKEYIQSARYCTLITVDSTGYPHARVMDPFSPGNDMIIWLGTNRLSRKAVEIKANSKVNLFYYDNKGTGYVSISGDACLIDDSEKKLQYWKPEWERFYENKKNYILIKVIPEKLEVLNYQRGIYGDRETWKTPSVEFQETDK